MTIPTGKTQLYDATPIYDALRSEWAQREPSEVPVNPAEAPTKRVAAPVKGARKTADKKAQSDNAE